MPWRSNEHAAFRSSGAQDLFRTHFTRGGAQTWPQLGRIVVDEVCEKHMTRSDREQLARYIAELKFLPSESLLRLAGRPDGVSGDAVALRAGTGADAAASLTYKAQCALMSGQGVGIDYSAYADPKDVLAGMHIVNEIGRMTLQGETRCGSILAGLSHRHEALPAFLSRETGGRRGHVQDGSAFDLTRTMVHFDTAWLLDFFQTGEVGQAFEATVARALRTGEPALAFNVFDREREVLRGSRGGMTAQDDSDMTTAGAVNLGRIESIRELADVVQLATQFLLCETLRPRCPFAKAAETRARTRRLGLSLMGLHEWLLRRGERYEVTPELHRWLSVWRGVSDETATWFAGVLDVPRPVACREVIPWRILARLAGTTEGIDPLFAVAYRREGKQPAGDEGEVRIHATAADMAQANGLTLDTADTALSLQGDIGRRLAVQADVQAYVDQGAVSVIRVPPWGEAGNTQDSISAHAAAIASCAHRLRSVVIVPDGAGGGPLHRAAERKDARDFTPA